MHAALIRVCMATVSVMLTRTHVSVRTATRAQTVRLTLTNAVPARFAATECALMASITISAHATVVTAVRLAIRR